MALTRVPAGIERLLINRNFALFCAGRAVSNIGDFVFDTTLILWVATRIAHGQEWAPLAVSGVLLSATIPTFAIGPVAGVLADRWDKRRTMLLMDALRAVLIGLLVPLPLLGSRLTPDIELAAVYCVVFLVQLCSLFFAPSRLSLIGDIITESERARASGLLEAVSNLAALIGPPLAPLLVFGLGVQWALLANAFSFIASFLTLRAVQSPEAAKSIGTGEIGNVRRELITGLRCVRRERVLVAIVFSVMLGNLGWGALDALNIFFLTQNLHVAASLYGLPSRAHALGAIVGAMIAAFLANRLDLVRLFWLSKLTLGVLVLAYARLTDFPAALVLFAILGVNSATTEVSIGPMILATTPRDLIGRVSMVMFPAAYLTRALSTSLAGFLDSTLLHDLHGRALGLTWRPVDTIFTGAGLLILIGGVYAALQLRYVRLGGGRVVADRSGEGHGGAA